MIYYSGKELFDRGYFLNFLKGPRGVGKTFLMKKRSTVRAVKKKSQFIWLRRYGTELDKDFRESFYRNIIKAANDPKAEMSEEDREELKDMHYQLEKNQIFASTKSYNGKDPIGYYYALSKTQAKKSVDYPIVNDVIFDEYIIKAKSTLHYLPNEFTTFMEFISTVTRLSRGKHVYCIGNNISFTDPYSLAFNMRPTKQRFTVYTNPANGKKNVCQEMYRNPEFENAMYNTEFGQIVQGTLYGAYAVENEALEDNLDFVAKKPPNALWRLGIRYCGVYIGFYLDMNEGRLYASRNYDRTSNRLYSLTREDHTLNTFLISNRKNMFMLRELASMFQHGDLYFEDVQLKTICLEMLQYIL